MPANRNLGKSLAYRAFRDARAAFADVINDDAEDMRGAIFRAKLKLDEFGIIRGHPLRSKIMAAVVACVRPSAFIAINDVASEQNAAACGELFGLRPMEYDNLGPTPEDTPSLPEPWWHHR